jgi:hypothetical protein
LIFLERGHHIDLEFHSVILRTGAEVIYNDAAVFWHRAELHPESGMNCRVSMLRHEWFRPWLEAHLDEVDRVFVYDASDTFFQADPFREMRNITGLLVHYEDITLSEWDKRMFNGNSWVKRCFNDRPKKEVNRVINAGKGLCCGCIGAEARTYLRFLQIMMDNHYWTKCFVDQAIVDYFWYNQTFLAAGLPVIVKSSESILHLTFSKWVPAYNGMNMSVFDLSADGRTLPAVVHGCKYGRCAYEYYKRCGFMSVEQY